MSTVGYNIEKALVLSEEPMILTDRYTKLVPLRKKVYSSCDAKEVPGWKPANTQRDYDFGVGGKKPYVVKKRNEIYKHPRYPSDPKLPKIESLPRQFKPRKTFNLRYTLSLQEIELLLKPKYMKRDWSKSAIKLHKVGQIKASCASLLGLPASKYEPGKPVKEISDKKSSMFLIVMFLREFIDRFVRKVKNPIFGGFYQKRLDSSSRRGKPFGEENQSKISIREGVDQETEEVELTNKLGNERANKETCLLYTSDAADE